MTPVEITAGRLHLRPWAPGDEDALVACMSNPEAVRWTPAPVPFTREEAVRRITESYPALWADDKGGSWAVVDAITAEVLSGLVLFGVQDGQAEVGYATLPAARGRGVTSEALGAVCRWGFGALGLRRLEAVIAVGNWSSRAVAHRCGFALEGVRREGMEQRGTRLDAWVLSLLAGDEMVDRRPLPRVPALTDGVVSLRLFRPEDAAAVQRACDDPLTAQWLPVPMPYTAEDGRCYVEDICPRGWAEGTEANFAVVDATTDELLGDIGLKLAHRAPLGVGEVGYWTAPWARGRGVAARATTLLSRWGLRELGLNRVELLAEVGNTASRRVAEKAGFVREGVVRQARPARDGSGRDLELFSLTQADLRTPPDGAAAGAPTG